MPNTCGILLTEAFKSRRMRRKQHKTKHSGRIEYYEKNKTNYSGGSCGNAACIKPFSAYAEPQTQTEIYSENSAGETVVRIQIRLRELGYLWFKPTGVYRAMTVKAVEEFQTRCVAYGERLGVDGRMGEQSMLELFAPSAPKFRIPDSVHLPRGPIADTLKVKGEVQSWNAVKQKLNVNEEYTVIDCNTGKEFKLVFTGGENHAEAELASESELEAFNYICGSEYNFLKRPVVVMFGETAVAASIQCYPHGSDSVADNGMEGHVCLFFEGSLSHVGSLPDVEHNANVFAAAGRG